LILAETIVELASRRPHQDISTDDETTHQSDNSSLVTLGSSSPQRDLGGRRHQLSRGRGRSRPDRKRRRLTTGSALSRTNSKESKESKELSHLNTRMRFENGRSNQDLEETSKNGVNLDMDNREGVPFSNGNGHLRSTSTNGNTTHKSGDASSTSSWHGHKREEVTRLIIQSLYDLGYTSSAEQLENESQCALESSEVATFRRAILNGQWATAENLLGSLDVQPHANMNVS